MVLRQTLESPDTDQRGPTKSAKNNPKFHSGVETTVRVGFSFIFLQCFGLLTHFNHGWPQKLDVLSLRMLAKTFVCHPSWLCWPEENRHRGTWFIDDRGSRGRCFPCLHPTCMDSCETVRETGHLVGCGVVSMLNTKVLTLKYFSQSVSRSENWSATVKLLMSHQNNKPFLKGCSSW